MFFRKKEAINYDLLASEIINKIGSWYLAEMVVDIVKSKIPVGDNANIENFLQSLVSQSKNYSWNNNAIDLIIGGVGKQLERDLYNLHKAKILGMVSEQDIFKKFNEQISAEAKLHVENFLQSKKDEYKANE